MKLKRILLILAGIIVAILVGLILTFSILEYRLEQNRKPPSYPSTMDDFDPIKYVIIDPATLLDDIRGGKKLDFQPKVDMQEYPPLMPISWPQKDILEVVQTYQKLIWQDDANMWHLFHATFHTKCDRAGGKFGGAEFYYYQEVTRDGERLYAARAIEIRPEYGFIAWGEDDLYPQPWFGGWTAIDLEKFAKVPAEQALALADQRGGNDYRNQRNNKCNITVTMWPWGYERSDWSVWYTGATSIEIWIPSE